MSLTAAQLQAIGARGNVLVVAGAGTGKTHTLVDRCLACLLDESSPANIDELLVVTFTEAAAAEMRQRIRAELDKRLQAKPADARLQEQAALFDTAFIGTLHSFCFQLVRQHFYELQLDPQLAILAEEEAPLLAQEILQQEFDRHYNGEGPASAAVRELVMGQARGSDAPVRALVMRLHRYTQTLPDPHGWFAAQLEIFKSGQPGHWSDWLCQAAGELRDQWLPRLRQAPGNPVAACCAAALAELPEPCSRSQCAATLAAAAESVQLCVRGKKKCWLEPWETFFEQVRFLNSLAGTPGEDPLEQDWNAVRAHMLALLGLARDFSAAFSEAKRELGVVDFSDLEQYALKLLWDPLNRKPTRVAEHWRKKLRFVFVDEYQDINAAQDKIIECLSREGAPANRFLVGDIKQSIYRFRLADPYIFQEYVRSWSKGTGTVIPLVENFRSREGILAFVNALFPQIMRRELGGVAYDELAALRFGGEAERQPLSLKEAPGPCVELHMRLKNSSQDYVPADDEEADAFALQVQDLEEADKEARMVGLRLKEMFEDRFRVWDDTLVDFRQARWSDMAILLRAPSGKSQRYAREFAKLGVPLAVARTEFYRSLEISDLLSVLQILDNPLQDVPVLAVLRSPLVGLTLEELGHIRMAARGRFWNALLRWHHTAHVTGTPLESAHQKVDTFLTRFHRWRRMAREVSLSRCLDVLLAETDYAAWLLTQPRGEQRHANLQRFLALAQKFDRFQRQSLFRFLRFIEAQQDAGTEPEVGSRVERDAVRLMSIHQSKGLQFPIVVVSDLAKQFNTDDLSEEIILDEHYGLCPQVQVPQTGIRYPSLPHWLASQRQKRELLGEELRLLYVAFTRARDHLVLAGSLSQNQVESFRAGPAVEADPANATNYWDWVEQWLASSFDAPQRAANQGRNPYVVWTLREDSVLVVSEDVTGQGPAAAGGADTALAQRASELSSWKYPFEGATKVPAKSSVTSLRRRAAARFDPGVLSPFAVRALPTATTVAAGYKRLTKERKPSSAEIGNAHHSFLELVSLECAGTGQALRAEAERLSAAGALTAGAVALLDFEALAAFWGSGVGQYVRAHGRHVRRELPFTVRLSVAEVAAFTGERLAPGLEREFVVVQGVADLVVLLPDEIRVIDFKTDSLKAEQAAERAKLYAPQLKIYACALARIYRRPVSECWLYFLEARQSVKVALPENP